MFKQTLQYKNAFEAKLVFRMSKVKKVYWPENTHVKREILTEK